MPNLSLAFLGSPSITLDGEPLQIGRRKSIALLAYLAASTESQTRLA
jgi:DNA-binding SARP family transcriptional activator